MRKESIPPQDLRESVRKLQIARELAHEAIDTLKQSKLGKSEPPAGIVKAP